MRINFNNPNYPVSNTPNAENVPEKKGVDANAPGLNNTNTGEVSNQSNVAFNSAMQFVNLTRGQQAILVRELLNLPKDLKDLLALLSYNEASPEAVIKLLQEQNKEIQLKSLQELFSGNSKEAISKLIKLLQPGPGNFQSTEQLNKLVNLINQTIPSPNSLPNEVLTKTILLYLPWLPLVQQQDISLRFEEGGEKDEEGQDNVALIMYISTINLGRFKVTIILNKDNSLNIEIESEEKEKYQSYVDQILNKINQELTTNHIAGKTNFYVQKSKTEVEPEKREVSIYPVSNISHKVMIAAYSTARIIFEIDERISLSQGRKQMI